LAQAGRTKEKKVTIRRNLNAEGNLFTQKFNGLGEKRWQSKRCGRRNAGEAGNDLREATEKKAGKHRRTEWGWQAVEKKA